MITKPYVLGLWYRTLDLAESELGSINFKIYERALYPVHIKNVYGFNDLNFIYGVKISYEEAIILKLKMYGSELLEYNEFIQLILDVSYSELIDLLIDLRHA